MAHLSAHDRLVGRLAAAEARLRLVCPDGVITAANRAKVDELTATIAELRAELGPTPSIPPPRPRRDVDD